MDLKKFSPKDAKIIRDNPGRTADELLDLGLSQKATQRLKDAASSTNVQVLQPVMVEALPSPKEKRYNPELKSIVRLMNMNTGRVVSIGHRTAERLIEAFPNQFKIAS